MALSSIVFRATSPLTSVRSTYSELATNVSSDPLRHSLPNMPGELRNRFSRHVETAAGEQLRYHTQIEIPREG